MSDLRPYLCTFEDCPQGAKTYASRRLWMEHELENHIRLNNPCPFCQDTVPAIEKLGNGRHVGRHLEEIAFTVVPKPYEDWEFYSDSSKDSPRRRRSLILGGTDGERLKIDHDLSRADILRAIKRLKSLRRYIESFKEAKVCKDFGRR